VPDIKIPVSHPGIVYARPRRGGAERLVLVPLVTEARLRSITLAETEEGPTLRVSHNGRVRTRVFEGRLWRRIGDADRRRDEGPAMTAGDLMGWLSGRAVAVRPSVIHCFAASPLVMKLDRYGSTERLPADFSPPPIGRPILDLRDEGREAVSRFVERDIALLDGVPMVRMAGPMVSKRFTMDQLDVVRHPGGGHANNLTQRVPYYRMDRAEDGIRTIRTIESVGPEKPLDPTWDPEDLSGYGYDGDEDIALTFAEAFRREVNTNEYMEFGDDDGGQRPLRAMLARSIVNLVRNEDLPLMADLLDRVFLLQRERWASAPYISSTPYRRPPLKAYLDEWARPILALRTAAVPQDDVEALAGIEAMTPKS